MDVSRRSFDRRTPRRPALRALCPRSLSGDTAHVTLRPIGPDEAGRVLGDRVGLGWVAGWQFGVAIEVAEHIAAVVGATRPWRIASGLRAIDAYTLEVRAVELDGSAEGLQRGVEAVAGAASVLGFHFLLAPGLTPVGQVGLGRAGWALTSWHPGGAWCRSETIPSSFAAITAAPRTALEAGSEGDSPTVVAQWAG